MKLTGAKYLDANDYDRLVIRNLNEELKINVKGVVRGQTIKADYPLSKDLRKESEDAIINELVDYFLRYNSIDKVEEFVYLPRYTGYFIGVLSNDKGLYLQARLNDNTKGIPKKILDKFYLDRHKSCVYNEEIKKYEIYTGRSISYKIEELNKEKIMKIFLKRKNLADLTMPENKFLEDFLREKLNSYEDEVSIEKQDKYLSHYEQILSGSWYLKIGDISITIKDNVLLPTLDKVIMEHNNEIRNAKSMQLKMKGY